MNEVFWISYYFQTIQSTVKPRISGTPNSGIPRISGQFMSDQLFV